MELLPLRNTERWLLAATIFVVIVYSWLLARALEPRFVVPKSVAAEVVWMKQGELVDSTDPAVRYSPAAVNVRRELAWASEAMTLLGPSRPAPVIVIAIDERERSVIGDDQVLVSGDLAASDGQILKALLKSWLYQNASPEITSSMLRMEVAAEFLSSVVRSRADQYNVRNWLGFASSFESSQADAANWGGSELKKFAGRSPNMNPLAFKHLLVAMLCEMFTETPRLQRFDYLRTWIKSLRWPPSAEFVAGKAPPETLSDWRSWLLAEFESLANAPLALKEQVIARAGLAEVPAVSSWLVRGGWKVDFAGISEAGVRPAILDLGSEGLWLVRRTESGSPVRVRLSERDRSVLRARQFVWEGCEPIKLGHLLGRSQGAEHILFISACDRARATEKGWVAYLSGGVREFARTRPDVPFVQIKRSAVELALRHGKLRSSENVGEFLNLKMDQIFGIESAQWSRDLRAYRVLGAIEAFEWIRGSPAATAM